MSTCSKLSANLIKDCDNPSVGGVSETLFLFNFDDWEGASYTTSSANSLVIDSLITLPGGTTGYKSVGYTNTVRPLIEFSRADGRPSYKHIVNFQVSLDDADTNLQIEKLVGGKYVAVVVTNTKLIKVFGATTGLQMADQALQDYYAANASFTLQLASIDETLEGRAPLIYEGSASPYDFATAKSEIEALIAS